MLVSSDQHDIDLDFSVALVADRAVIVLICAEKVLAWILCQNGVMLEREKKVCIRAPQLQIQQFFSQGQPQLFPLPELPYYHHHHHHRSSILSP